MVMIGVFFDVRNADKSICVCYPARIKYVKILLESGISNN